MRVRSAFLTVALAAVSLLTVDSANAGSVTSGPARLTTSSDAWSFEADLGGPVLRQAPGTPNGPTGTLGFQTALGWYHATKALSERREGEALAFTLATNDPLKRTLEVRIAPDADGVIAMRTQVAGPALGAITNTGVAFAGEPKERYLGFGERSNAVDQRGRDVENFVADGPYQPDEAPFIAATVPTAGVRDRLDATYFPIPWLLSTRGFGVLVDDDETSFFRLGTDRADAWSVEVQAAKLNLRFFAGPKPANVVARMSASLGRQPPLEAPFFLGPWFQTPKGKDDASFLKTINEADAPASIMQTYTHYLPCGDQQGKEQAERDRVKALNAAGLAVTTYFNPMVCSNYTRVFDAASKANVLHKNPAGQPLLYRYTGSTSFLVGQFDFTAPGADAFYASLLREAVADGHEGWMEDFGEYTPDEAVSADGTPGRTMHNRYPLLYHRSGRRFADGAGKPIARFQRSGWRGSAKFATLVWGGDPTVDWGFDGLESSVRQALTMGLSGVSRWGSDIGGFFAIGKRRLSPELLTRWIQFGAASGVMRTQANGFNIPAQTDRPQITDEKILPVWRRYAKLRTQLFPYLAGAEKDYDATGLPLMRHLALEAPDDEKAVAREDEFLLGPDLLVAPVVAPGQRSRDAYLPAGRWVDLWRSARMDADGTLRAGAARVLEGGTETKLDAPLDELPLLVRAGAVLPLLPADVDTLTDHGSAPGLVHLRDRPARRLVAFPRGPWRGRLGPDGTMRSNEGRGRWVLRVDGPRRAYTLEASLATLRKPMTSVCSVHVNHRRQPKRFWSFDAASSVLTVRFRLGRGPVSVRPCAKP